MSSEDELEELLLKRLAEINFDVEFYRYCDEHDHAERMNSLDMLEIQDVIAGFGYSAKVHKRDRSLEFISAESFGKCGFYIQVLRASASLDFTFVLFVGQVNLSNNYAGLARKIGMIRKRRNEHKPPYPIPAFRDKVEMKEVIRFSLDLFEKAQAVCAATFGRDNEPSH